MEGEKEQKSESESIADTESLRTKTIRKATHAGTWYSKQAIELEKQIDSWFGTAKKEFKEVT